MYREKIFENLPLKIQLARKASVYSSLSKSRSPGVGWGHIGELNFYIGFFLTYSPKMLYKIHGINCTNMQAS